ncbi:bifunctional DNA primase/polymerase [Micromonospora zhanjiangensis]|uniref:Bifunctional DNA primase/polymerase n=1 Tax=Micromonospora zhanjiangensis TaxID=1522057 RepID=A0ABV8KI17_9ACTN
MRGTFRPTFIELTSLDRVRLRRVAMRYAGHGWDVTPGACLARHRFVCGRPGCPTTGCHPALTDWERSATADPARIAAWWRSRPHGVLLATGRAFDAIEVPAHLGQRVVDVTRWATALVGPGGCPGRGPVAVTPTGRWIFLVRPGDPLRPELDRCLFIVRHGLGSWIPAPPTRLPEGPVRWATAPEETRWRLPDPYAVQELLVDALHATNPAVPVPVGPAAGHLPAPRTGD